MVLVSGMGRQHVQYSMDMLDKGMIPVLGDEAGFCVISSCYTK